MLGSTWVNVSLIETVHVLMPAAPAQANPTYQVRFVDGLLQTFGGDEGQALLEFLSSNRAA